MQFNLNATAREQVEWLSSGKITSAALLELYVDRYQTINPSLNAIIKTDLESARLQAKVIDERRAKGEAVGALGGLPMTIKDTFDVDGMPAVAGAPVLADRPKKTADAEVVKRLKEAGAIFWGKTNTPLYAGDVQTYNKVYGTTNNPHDVSRTPAGSSGGAAAALASAMTPLEVGSDIGGSLRTPAHNCGICTLKPTYGVVPLKGHVPPPPGVDAPDVDLAVAGPMARNVQDVQLLLSIIAPDVENAAPSASLSNVKFAIWEEAAFALGKDVKIALSDLEKIATEAGATVLTDKPEIDGKELVHIYQRLLVPIITADVPVVMKTIFKLVRPLAGLIARKGEMSLTNTILSASQSAEALDENYVERAALKKACDAFFSAYDILIAPVTAVPAIEHNTDKSLYSRHILVDGKKTGYPKLFEWISLATTCHLPAAVIPIRQTAEGLPVGLQLIGREGDDSQVLAIAALLEKALGDVVRPSHPE